MCCTWQHHSPVAEVLGYSVYSFVIPLVRFHVQYNENSLHAPYEFLVGYVASNKYVHEIRLCLDSVQWLFSVGTALIKFLPVLPLKQSIQIFV